MKPALEGADQAALELNAVLIGLAMLFYLECTWLLRPSPLVPHIQRSAEPVPGLGLDGS